MQDRPSVEQCCSASRSGGRHGREDAIEHISWDRAPFEQRPFLRLESGGLVLISPRMIASWFTDGLYYRLLDCARARARADRPDKNLVPAFTSFFGAVTETYASRLAMSAHATQQRAGAAIVAGEVCRP